MSFGIKVSYNKRLPVSNPCPQTSQPPHNFPNSPIPTPQKAKSHIETKLFYVGLIYKFTYDVKMTGGGGSPHDQKSTP